MHIGQIAPWVHRDFHARFGTMASELGFDRTATNLQWRAVAKVAAVAGIPPDRLTRETFDTGARRLLDAVEHCIPAVRAPESARPTL